MNDLISRQAAINTVFSMCCGWDTEDKDDLRNMIMLAFQELPSAELQTVQQWVPVEERLPEETGWFLVSTLRKDKNELEVSTAWFSKRHGFEILEKVYSVYAWMPLPEPYKGGKI